jgi:phage protein D
MLPSVLIGAGRSELPEAAHDKMSEVVIDRHSHLPDMFEITFFDLDPTEGPTKQLGIGTELTIRGASAATPTAEKDLITGEVTAIEGQYGDLALIVVRGYSKDHRLQRATKTRTFVNMTDSDIARKVATDAGLRVGTVQVTRASHEHVGQVNQTDWEFLTERARRIGFEALMVDGQFCFRQTGPSGSAAPVELTYTRNLRRFFPRITAGNIDTQAEARVWDPDAAKVTSQTARSDTDTATLSSHTPSKLAGLFTGRSAAAKPATNLALGDLGPAPTANATVGSRAPLATGSAIGAAASAVATGRAAHEASTFAEAEGEAMGDPALVPGASVKIAGVADAFCGTWVLTRARHIFDTVDYHTEFEVSGHHERSLLGLSSRGSAPETRMPGAACGIVSNTNDPDKKGRVKVVLPWLSPEYESDWARVVHPGAGRRSGALFLPEVGDEVLVVFEFGDPARAYVLGGLRNVHSTYSLGGEPVMATGRTAAIVRRGIVSGSGNLLAFHDELPPNGQGPPRASDLVLGTGKGNLALAIDQTAGTVTLRCDPKPPDAKSAQGRLSIECGQAGAIDIKTGAGGEVNVDGGARLNLKAEAEIKVQCTGPVEIKGNPIKLN